MSDDTRSTSSPEPSGRGLSHWLGQFLDRLGLRHGGSIREDITEALAQDGGGVTDLSPQERAMLSNVLSLRERRVADVMVPRADVIAVSSEATLGDLLALFRTAGHSRLPVYGESLDDPRGMIHIRDFLDCVKTRSRTKANADAACYTHIACHAANIAIALDRKLTYDLEKHEFVDDAAANRLRSEALREPWRI